MLTSTVSSKGQVVIPAEVRQRLGLHPGDRVVFDDGFSDQEAVIRRRESRDELLARVHSRIAREG